MVIIACIDTNGTMMFNGRRQSQDRLLRKRVIEMTKGHKLYMNNYTAEQFEEYSDIITVDEDYLSIAQFGDYCFVEDDKFYAYQDRIDKLILYKWNEAYPYDMHFPLDFTLDEWTFIRKTDFVGSSHDRITEEIYTLNEAK
ncbi:MAG: ribonuclease Z [Clostridia bacterium]|nr:ribonuclease Z [Clostridia bacterium]